MESSDKYDVFISFKAKDNDQPTKDAQIARELKEFLENYGVKTFYSDQDVRDSNYSDSIDRALEEAKLLFLIGTKKEYLDSKWIKEEHNRFFNLKVNPQRFIITESVIKLPTYLITVQFYKFNDPGFWDVIRELCKNINIEFNDDKYLQKLSSGEGREIMQKLDELESTSKLLKPTDYKKIRSELVETINNVIENKITVEVLNRDITSSISHARKIQEALLPSKEKLEEVLGPENYFIYYEPKNTVSGDFYWVYHNNSNIIVIVADCSGYGVPAALVSAMTVPILHNIIIRKAVTDTALILENLRKDFLEIILLKDLAITKVYVDITVISINTNEKTIDYSSSFGPPVYLFRKPAEQASDTLDKNIQLELREGIEILSTRSDSFLIGYQAGSMPFSKIRINYEGGEMIYLSTDGYTDQLGGDFGQKLLAKKYRAMLLKTWNKPMREQRDNVYKVHSEWKGNREQSDDILVLGIRLQ